MKPPARAIVGNVVWSADTGAWAVWRVEPFPHASIGLADKLGIHSRLRGMLMALPVDSMLLSIAERIDTRSIVEQMAEGINLERHPAWGEVCAASGAWLEQVPLRRRRYYLAVALPQPKRAWWEVLKTAAFDVNSTFGVGPQPVSADEVDDRQQQARELQLRLGQHVPLTPATAGELCWLYARALRRPTSEPPFDDCWEPSLPATRPARGIRIDRGRSAHPPLHVLAHLTDAVVREGGDAEDEDRPRHRRYVRIDSGNSSSYQTVMAMADMPHRFWFPDGGGEWLHEADQLGFPVDWCVRIKSVKNADAQAKVLRKHRDLLGQLEQYEGEVSGAPPQLAEAIHAMDEERAALGGNPAEAELQVTVLLGLAARSLPELEANAGAIQAMFEPHEYALARPTGGQADLLRAMWPGTATPVVARDYSQFMLARDLAAGSPFCRDEVGDPRGLLLGVTLEGNDTPVLFDPAYGPQVNASPSLATVGRLGSGKSFFLKRLCWDALARGGQVVTIDRTRSGEYVRFGDVTPGTTEVVRLEPGANVCFDPMRSFTGHERETITLGFLSLLTGCSLHSEEGAALAEAVDKVTERADSRLVDVVAELDRMGSNSTRDDAPARSLARRLAHYVRSQTGQLAFGDGESLSLDADFIVFWAPSLALPDRETLSTAGGADVLLPEQIIAQAMLYLVAAVGRRVVFSDPTRFAAALYDEAWALLASPHGRSLLIEGVRDGRKHNGAIWLASQHPNDVAVGELADLLGSRFVFDQARRAVPAALELLGAVGNDAASIQLEAGLATGQCLYRDVRGRLGALQVLPPALARLDAGFDTSPTAPSAEALPAVEVLSASGEVLAIEAADDREVEAASLPTAAPRAAPAPVPAPLPEADPEELAAEAEEAEPLSRRRPRRNPVAEVMAKGG